MSAQLEVKDLSLSLSVDRVHLQILREVSFGIEPGESLGLVGESGSGKSMTARAITGMLPKGAKATGEIRFGGASFDALDWRTLVEDRRSAVALIPQDPRAWINPVHTVGDFLTEPLRVLHGVSSSDAAAQAVASLEDVGIADGRRRLGQYPHELSGGLLQRVMICAALISGARLIVADEPTTALDVTTQSEVMAILNDLRTSRQLSLLFITHDLELATAVCDRIAVMYAGEIIEIQRAERLEEFPRHPYTHGLLLARPSIAAVTHPLPSIPGRAVSLHDAGDGCAFAPRCAHATAQCDSGHPVLVQRGTAMVRCVRADELDLVGSAEAQP